MRSMVCSLCVATVLLACSGASDLAERGGAGLAGTSGVGESTGGSDGAGGGTGGSTGGSGGVGGSTGGGASGGTGGSTGGRGSGGVGGSTGGAASGGTGGGAVGGTGGTSGGGQDPDCPLMKPVESSACVGPLTCKFDAALGCLCADEDCTGVVPACTLNSDGSGGSDNADRALPLAGAPAFGMAGSSGKAVPLSWLICTCLESGWYCR